MYHGIMLSVVIPYYVQPVAAGDTASFLFPFTLWQILEEDCSGTVRNNPLKIPAFIKINQI